jgi:hypothetical protein
MYRIDELENESRFGKDSNYLNNYSQNVLSEGGNFEKVVTEVHDSIYDIGNKPQGCEQ